jgi:hypothetical protein
MTATRRTPCIEAPAATDRNRCAGAFGSVRKLKTLCSISSGNEFESIMVSVEAADTPGARPGRRKAHPPPAH